ncbi:adenylyltransferase [candidate division MSBL1 archaeon SCGC-AAA259O05]|uniref:Adenylyltransferase n=1 Tax=candidate division MSBL1 archaeon SCGC-AAA259O05 TaxID=1698271 RepID=A0A133V5M6_9EURY|nr:adenylyltransferase [candidate division MSBL1 archaeon SCGC-AAA259O05]
MAGGKEEFGFSEDQIVRYSRQIVLPEVGGKGQRKLLDSNALVVGAGALGSPAILYLAGAGVGKIGIVDDDEVDLSNLQRQVIHGSDDVGKPKVDSAKETINRINPELEVKTYEKRLEPENVFEIIRGWDMVIDGSDNFPTKFLVNDSCTLEGTPFSHGGILRFMGMCTTVLPGEGPCYRCFAPEAPPEGAVPSCQEAGVLGSIPGIIGSIQASEAIKYLLGLNGLLTGRMLYLDASEMKFDEFEFKRNPDCPSCGDDPEITDLSKVDYGHVCEVSF